MKVNHSLRRKILSWCSFDWPFPSSKNCHFQNDARRKTFVVTMSCIIYPKYRSLESRLGPVNNKQKLSSISLSTCWIIDNFDKILLIYSYIYRTPVMYENSPFNKNSTLKETHVKSMALAKYFLFISLFFDISRLTSTAYCQTAN